MASAERPTPRASGIMVGGMENIDPNMTVTAAPVVLVNVTSKYRSKAARPSPAPTAMPVTRSRSRTRRAPASSIPPAAMTAIPRKPSSEFIPRRNEADPPALLTSARA